MDLGIPRDCLPYEQEPSSFKAKIRLLLTLIVLMLSLSACRLKQEQGLKFQEQGEAELLQQLRAEQELKQIKETDIIVEEVSLLYDSLRLKEVKLRRREQRTKSKNLKLAQAELQNNRKTKVSLNLKKDKTFRLQNKLSLGYSLTMVLGLIIGLFIAKLLRK